MYFPIKSIKVYFFYCKNNEVTMKWFVFGSLLFQMEQSEWFQRKAPGRHAPGEIIIDNAYQRKCVSVSLWVNRNTFLLKTACVCFTFITSDFYFSALTKNNCHGTKHVLLTKVNSLQVSVVLVKCVTVMLTLHAWLPKTSNWSYF